jgi:flagellar hook-associated protein 2
MTTTGTPSSTGTATTQPTTATPLFNVGGIATGLDTNAIINQLLAIDRAPETLIQQRSTVEQARGAALQSIRTSLQAVQDAAQAMRDPAVWANSQTVTSSNPTAVSAVLTSGAAAGGFQIGVQKLASADQVTQRSGLTTATADDILHIQVGSGTVADVTVTAGDTLSTIASAINSNNNSQVYASVINNQLVLSGQVTGGANTISVTSDGTLASDLGMTQSLTASDAQFTVNGQAQTSASNIVSTALAGVTMTLNGTTANDSTLVVSAPAPSTSKITNSLQSFVTAYNSAVNLIYGYVNQPKVGNPASDADREAGMLQGDPQLLSILSKLRESVSTTMSGGATGSNYLGSVGLSTGKAVGSGTISQASLEGQLTLDTDKLTSALASNFSGVKALFTNATGTYSSEGLSQRMDDIINPQAGSNGILASRVTSEQSLVSSYSQQIADIEQRVTMQEANLRAQFTAMETAVAQLQASSSSLSSSTTSTSGG